MIDRFIEQALKAKTEAQAREKEELQAAKARREIDLTERTRNLLQETLTPSLMEELPFTYITPGGVHEQYAFAVTSYLGMEWWFLPNRRYHSDPVSWRIEERYPQSRSCVRVHEYNIEPQFLQSCLLAILGEHKADLEAAAQKQAEMEELAAKRSREYQVQERQREDRRRALTATADQEHQRLAALIEECVQEAKETMWRWPAGATITFYLVTWCVGSYQDGDSGELSFDYKTGWSQDKPILEPGWVTLLPERSSPWSRTVLGVRRVFLNPVAHHPEWQEMTCHSLEDLPKILKENIEYVAHGIVRIYSHEWNDSKRRYAESREGDWVTEPLGERPLPWVQALHDQIN